MKSKTSNSGFSLDKRPLSTLQRFMLEFASQLKGPDQLVNWKEYLQKDLSFILAELLTLQDPKANDVDRIKRRLEEYCVQHPEDDLGKRAKQEILEWPETHEDIKRFLTQIKDYIQSLYQFSLTHKADHAPDLALLLVFSKLYQDHLLADLNQLPKKLNQFYYKSILNTQQLDPTPDLAHVYFEPAKFVTSQFIPKGLPLYAGKDDNKSNVIFKTLHAVRLSNAKLMDIRTLHFTSDPNANAQGIFQRFCFSTENLDYKYFETFGRNVALYKIPEPTETANFGFVIASNLLHLKEGERVIRIYLPLSDETIETLTNYCEFFITTHKGWVKIDENGIDISTQENVPNAMQNEGIDENGPDIYSGVQVEIKVDSDFPSIEPTRTFADKPALKCRLRQNLSENPAENYRLQAYNAMKGMNIDLNESSLEVEVEGVKALTCYNDLGILNTNQQFQPFGPNPSRNSKFIVGSAEAFQKSLERVTLDMDWELPSWDFQDYYAAYEGNFKERGDYRVKAAFPNRRENTEKALFEGQRQKVILELALDMDQFESWKDQLPDYTRAVKWGYLELKLIAPDHPFGTGLYQQVLVKNMNDKMNNPNEELQVINPPMIPELNGIELGYKTKKDKQFDFFHIHPFGKEKMQSEGGTLPLISTKYEYNQENDPKPYQGLLFLGIQNLPAGLISLYFELAGSSLFPSDSERDFDVPEFFLLSNNELKPISKVLDTTEGFEQSGIIQLNIEQHLMSAPPSTILPSDLSWIVVAVRRQAENFGLTNGIHLHGAAALQSTGVRAVVSNESRINHETAPQIIRTWEDIPAIKKVIQPHPSLSGRQAEQDDAFRERIRTGVRHRGRPAYEEDIESRILQAFPQIGQCRVFPKKGELETVVIPHKQKDTVRPVFPISFLQKVKDFIRGFVSPFLKVVVENPHYAILQTHFYLSLKDPAALDNLGWTDYHMKKKIIYEHLDPWSTQRNAIGLMPSVIRLNRAIQMHLPTASIEKYQLYYYFIKNGDRHFAVVTPDHSIQDNLFILPDYDLSHHTLKLYKDKWEEHKRELDQRESERKPIDGFPDNFRFTRDDSIIQTIHNVK